MGFEAAGLHAQTSGYYERGYDARYGGPRGRFIYARATSLF